jgi:biotin transport system substrate-specific component
MTANPLAIPRPGYVLCDLIPRSAVRDGLLIVSGAALVGALAQIAVPLGFTPVPITGQTLGVLLAGTVLGAGRGVLALALYAVAGLAGLPWFAGASSGWSAASFGYVLGFIAAAAVCGALASRGADRRPLTSALAMVAAMVIVYAVGTAWLWIVTGLPAGQLLPLGVVPFLPGDIVKIALAAGLTPGAWRLAGGLSSS